jgi:hypothetical protein
MMNSLMRSVITVATALLAATGIGAQSGTVSGTFAVNGKEVRLQHISAVTYDTPSQGRLISVLASDKPPDHKKFLEYVGPDEKPVPGMVTGAWVAMHADDKAFAGFQFTITPDRRIMLNDVLVGERNDNFSVVDDALVLELTSVAPKVTGRIRTKDPVADLGSQKVAIDLTFDAPVVPLGK